MNETTIKEHDKYDHVALEVFSPKATVWIGRGWKTVWEAVDKPSTMARAVTVEYDPCKDYGRVDTYPVENFERNPDLVEKIARLALDYVGRYQNTQPAGTGETQTRNPQTGVRTQAGVEGQVIF